MSDENVLIALEPEVRCPCVTPVQPCRQQGAQICYLLLFQEQPLQTVNKMAFSEIVSCTMEHRDPENLQGVSRKQ